MVRVSYGALKELSSNSLSANIKLYLKATCSRKFGQVFWYESSIESLHI